jgi:hypothetical protein
MHDFSLPPQSRWELWFLGYYAVSSVDFLLMFLDTVSVLSSGDKILTPEDGTNYWLCNIPEEHSSQNANMFLHVLSRIYFP